MTIATDSPDWANTRLRYQARLNPSVRSEIRSALDTEITFLAMDSIGEDGTIQRDTSRPVSEVLTGYSYFENNDVLMAKVTPCFENGKGALITGLSLNAGFGTTEVTVLRPEATLDPRFLFYLTSEDRFKQGGVAAMTGAGGLKRVPDSYVRDFELAVPNVQLQGQIADYLDAQTAKIDALIGKQEQLIETLAERRQAVISHAVTKGLDPNAPMKDSGISWLGAIPKTWNAMSLRWALRFLTSGSRGWAEYYADEGDPFIRIGNLTRGFLHLDMADTQLVQIPNGAEGTRAVVQPGDVLFSITAYLGSVAVAQDENRGSYVSQHVALVRLNTERLVPRFLGYYVLSEMGQRQLNEQAYGGTKVQLSLEDIKSFLVIVPPTSVQTEIVENLDHVTAQIDTLSAKAREMIDMLKERRQALISAAVTGKINVRGLA